MKRIFLLSLMMTMLIVMYAQYNVGTSISSTDVFGRSTTTHTDADGRTTGTSTTSTDYLGHSTTTYTDAYGRTTGSSTSYTDVLGKTVTNQQSSNKNTTIWTW